ncbi:MAG: LLM class F420-dependent oxidoreductase [Myxococcota bacterium]
MRFSFWPGPAQPWSEVLELARHVEATGWDGIWYADHFMPNAADTSGPWNEAWTVLSALAAAVPRIRIGPLVTGNTYRHPAVLAKMAATVDQISEGRLVLGLGSGWQENEHAAYGIPFYTTGDRLRRLEEACQVIRSLFSEEKSDFDGKYYQLEDAPLEPKPVQQPLPLLIGGGGEKVTLRIAARYADEWNTWGDVATLVHKMEVLERHCAEVGRDPVEIQRSAVAMLFLSDDARFIEQVRGGGGGRPMIAGNAEEVAQVVKDYAEAGVDELVIPDFNLGPRERKVAILDRFIREVAPVAR